MGTPTLLGGKLRRTELSCLLLVMGRDGPEAVVLFLMTDAFLPGGSGALGLVGGGPLVVVGHYRHCSPPAGSADPVSASSVCPPRTWQCTLHAGNATIQGQCCQVPYPQQHWVGQPDNRDGPFNPRPSFLTLCLMTLPKLMMLQ